MPKCVLGSLPRTRRSAIGQFFSLSHLAIPEVFVKVNTAQLAFVSLSGELLSKGMLEISINFI